MSQLAFRGPLHHAAVCTYVPISSSACYPNSFTVGLRKIFKPGILPVIYRGQIGRVGIKADSRGREIFHRPLPLALYGTASPLPLLCSAPPF